MRKHIAALALPLAVATVVLILAFGLFVAIFGWDRFVTDFFPLDNSRVGPNLCASVVLIVLLIAHNEYVVVKRAAKLHKSHREATEDVLRELLHPTEEAEDEFAEAIEKAFRDRVLNQLDENTEGGLGTILEHLKKEGQ